MSFTPQVPSQLASIQADGSRAMLLTADVRGRYIRARRALFVVLMGLYVAAPLVPVGGHPAVHLDVVRRRFYLFGQTFNAQDFWLVVLLVVTFALSLLFVTAWRGRLWCGWACPQTVFLEGLFRPIERWIEGSREARLRAARDGWTAQRVVRAVVKHAAFVLVAWLLAHVALALFASVPAVLAMLTEGPGRHPTAFGWSMAFTAVLYGNFAWFREQFCVVLCPYGRMQSVLHDRDTVVIGYDAGRGEPRGHLKQAAPRGACIDCKRCVAVCPTGIDIRNGLQMECVGCAQCIDACDEVMDKVDQPRGLIRYASQNALEARPTRTFRPRLALYGAALLVASTSLGAALATRTPFEANVLRMAGVPYVLEGTSLRNQLEVHLVNKGPTRETFELELEPAEGAEVLGLPPRVELESLADARVPLVVRWERARYQPGRALRLHVRTPGAERVVMVPVLGPP